MRSLFLLVALALPVFAQPNQKQIVVEGIEAPETAGMAPVLVPPLGHVEIPVAVALTPDGRFALSASHDQTLRWWELATGREVRATAAHRAQAWTVAVSPDGRTVLTGGGDHTINVWDAQTGKKLRAIGGIHAHKFAFFPDGKRFVAAGSKGIFNIYSLDTGAIVKEFPLEKEIQAVALNADGTKLLSGSNKSIKLWDANAGTVIREWTDGPEFLYNIAFSRDGKFMVACGSSYTAPHDTALALWDVNGGQRVWSIKSEGSGVRAFAISPNGESVFYGGGGQMRAVDAKTGQEKGKSDYISHVYSLAVGHIGDQLILIGGLGDTTVRLWNINGAKIEERQVFTGATRRTVALAISPDGRQIVSGLENPKGNEYYRADGIARVWDAASGRVLRELPGHKSGVTGAVFSADGRWLLTNSRGADEKGLHLWDAATGAKVRDFSQTSSDRSPSAINFDGTLIAHAHSGEIRIIDAKTGQLLHALSINKPGENSAATAPGFSADGNTVMGVGGLGSVYLWDAKTGAQKQNFSVGESIEVARLSRDGRTIALSTRTKDYQKYQVELWDAQTGTRKFICGTHGYFVRDLEFSPDDSQFATGSEDGVVKIWDTATGKQLKAFAPDVDEMSQVAWSASGRYLLSASNDNKMRLWDVAAEKELLTYLILDKGDWLAYTADGYFDGSPGGIQKVHFARGLQTYSLDQFYERFYRPNLISIALRGENISPAAGAQTLAQTVISGAPPLVKITSPQAGASTNEQIEVTVEARQQNNGGIKAIRLYHNGRLVGGPPTLRGIVVEAAAPNQDTQTQKFNVVLAPGENVLRAVAYSQTDIESRADEVKLTRGGAGRKPGLFVLAVGINSYRDATMDLSYARPDAEAMATFFDKTARACGLFSDVKVEKLLDEAATGKAIRDSLTRFAAQAGPDDMVFLYLAGHGETASPTEAGGDEETFYFLPHEMRQMALKERVREIGISGRDIEALISKIPARKIVLIYDACKSGAAVAGGVRGSADEQAALAVLARAQGIHILTASTSQQYAAEVRALGHGILTYALLEGLQGKAAGPDSLIKVRELMSYVEERVPQLAKEHRGREQWPVPFGRGQNFPLVVKR